MPKVSVIIPVYNVEQYLSKCLESIINQTLQDIEIICINDGSTDNSLQILEEYAQKDSRIIVINQQNQGVGEARNKGLEIARGDYIWFVDSDDYVERNGLDYVYEKSKENNADIVCFGVNNICKSTIISGHTNQYLSEINMTCQIDLNIKKHFLHNIWDKLFSRKFIQNIIKFPNGILTAEDGIFNLFCLYKEPKYLFINKILYNYRTDRNLSATNDKKNVINNDLKAFKYITTSNAFQATNEQYKIITIDKFIDGILYYFYKYENKDYELLYIKQIEEYKNYITQNIDKEILNKCNNIKKLKKLTYAKFILRQLFSISNKNNNGKKEKLIIILGRHLKWSSNKSKKTKTKRNPIILFFKNITYLARFNLKEIYQKQENQIDYAVLSEIALYKTISKQNNFLLPNIKSNFETIEELLNTQKSIIRFGEGEFKLMEGYNIDYQFGNEKIASILKEIFYEDNPNLMTGTIWEYYDFSIDLTSHTKQYIYNWIQSGWYHKIEKFYNKTKTYYSAFISMVFAEYEKYEFEKHYALLRKIWDNKNITLVIGDRVLDNIEFFIFDNAKNINYIYGPTQNAYSQIDILREKLKQSDKNDIFIFAIGPCGKILAYEMYQAGYRVLDLGHLIKDYNFYQKAQNMSKEAIEKERLKFFLPD